MKNVNTFKEFVNEARQRDYAILSIGRTNLLTGKSKYWNFYDEWLKSGDMTCEIYDSTATGKADKFVFTSGDGTVDDIKPGDGRTFEDDQTGRYLFNGTLIVAVPLKDLKKWAKKNGIKSGTGYVYK